MMSIEIPAFDAPALPDHTRDDNPYADLREWDVEDLAAAACEMSWELWEGVPQRVCLIHDSHTTI